MNRPIAILLAILAIFSQSCSGQVKSKAFETTIDNLLDETVDTVGVVVLHQELKTDESVVILDAREKKEYDVSHIPGAIYVGYEQFNAEALKDLDSNAQLVVYCSIGYRSEKIGEKLDSMGYSDVRNLYGGIFEWVNQGHSVESSTGTTAQVHGFDKWWAKFLQRGQVVLD